MTLNPSFSAGVKAACARREVDQRRHVYPRLIERGEMSRERATREIAIMIEIAEEYAALARLDELPFEDRNDRR